jgi:hypothetical protein
MTPMKIIVNVLLVALLMSSGYLASAEAIEAGEPPKYKNLFTLKAEKQFIGSQVEIYNSRGQLVTSQSLQKRKMIIDFGEVQFGTYTIKVSNGTEQREFTYIKK